jgi:alkanesulfonate monooxygenase SsuD/methylene tetrahydromethanopterin reductase-like flavin-dependent oxidoreductase (luciferase family)
VKTPTFGLFDHIEGIPGDTPTKIFKDRLDFIRTADQAGFRSFHLAEHHGTDLSMAPNQDVFIAAASQITENIRLGPMVKLLPMHHPVQVVEDLCVLDHLTDGRLDYGVGRGAVPVEHAWHGGDFRSARKKPRQIVCQSELRAKNRLNNLRCAPPAARPSGLSFAVNASNIAVAKS